MLLNNAAVGDKGDSFEGLDKWKAVMDVNLFGYVVFVLQHAREASLKINYISVLNVQHTFVPVKIPFFFPFCWLLMT